MAGRFFNDEWRVGDHVAHAITRTVTETDKKKKEHLCAVARR